MEFQNLTQNSGMTVAQYETEFTILAHYAPHLIPEENMKARRFEGGLNPDLPKLVKSLKLPTYAEVLDRSLTLEDESAKTDHVSEPKKRKNEDQNTSNGQTKRPNTGGQGQNQNWTENRPNCLNCGRAHIGICLKGSTSCYGCGEPGHIRRNCPKNSNVLVGNGDQRKENNKTGSIGQGQRQERAYTIFPGDT
ncbi:hypothetical protein RHGRI_037428 [Rhododendron griersonianum]|uniref:CCHC-type domain-containing protein n=1 Tax=Rhododendron griersonianum TaxID=479676 RepID=A0AAV6HVX3_9ERIC|nr:hypothetical protein RHGRI_037428 [Rhododendron griersonianum]